MSNSRTSRTTALLKATQDINFCILYQNANLEHIWCENLPSFWGSDWRQGATNADFIKSPIADALTVAQTSVLQTGVQKKIEISVLDGSTLHWFEFWIDCDLDDQGKAQGLITIAREISESKRREQVLKTLLREVSHRSKNLLAIVQSIASQTARYSDTTEDFLEKFQGRVLSLSSSQDLITESDWRGALLQELVHSQLSRYRHQSQTQITLTGENPYLFPNAALHIGLAIHELIVNATSFGGLTNDKGYVKISANRIPRDADNEDLQVLWEEFNPTFDASAKHTPRFGESLLRRIVPASVSGVAEYRREGQILIYSITIPAQQFDL